MDPETTPIDTPTSPTSDNASLGEQLSAAHKRIAELENQAAKQQTVYAGLQTKYNNLQTGHTTLNEQHTSLQTEFQTLQEQLTGMDSEKATLSTQLQTLEGEKTQLQKDLAAASLRHQMMSLIAEKYSNLLPMIGTLDPKADLEATEQMLQGLSQGIEATVMQKMAGYVPGGNFSTGTGSHSTQKSADLLYQEAMTKAGTPEYDTAITAWFDALSATKQMPEIPVPTDTPFLSVPQ
jgi:hypothetical protein